MSAISGLGTPQTDQSAQQAAAGKSSQQLGQADFLKLLVTQLQNQDPMNPMDNQQFVAQLATFSSLEQLMSINNAVTKLAGTLEQTGSANSPIQETS
jgi:flagellar basal-body rod modification protein FlgD